MVNLLNPRVDLYIDSLANDLHRLKELDTTANVRRDVDESDPDGVFYLVEATLLGGDAYAGWSIFGYYRANKSRPVVLADTAWKYFRLTGKNGNIHTAERDAVINFASQITGEVVSDFPDKVEINSPEPFDVQNPYSKIVGEASLYVIELLKTRQNSKLRPSSRPLYTQAKIDMSSRQSPKDPFYGLRDKIPQLWELFETYGNWKSIPAEELRKAGYERKVTGQGSRITVDIQEIS